MACRSINKYVSWKDRRRAATPKDAARSEWERVRGIEVGRDRRLGGVVPSAVRSLVDKLLLELADDCGLQMAPPLQKLLPFTKFMLFRNWVHSRYTDKNLYNRTYVKAIRTQLVSPQRTKNRRLAKNTSFSGM